LKYKILIIIGMVFLIAGCAPGGKLKDADDYYDQEKYVPAVLMYDDYIEKHSHSAEETIAELQRSECYYNLGVQSYTRKNLPLAERLLYLANSENGDELLDNVHLELAEKAYINGEIDLQLSHYDFIADYIKTSELVPAALLGRIKIYLERVQRVAAYRDYKRLWDEYPDSPEAESALTIIDPVIPWFLQNSRRNKDEGNYATAIAEFLVYEAYPSSYWTEIITEVSETYYFWGLQERCNGNLAKMMDYFERAEQYSIDIKPRVTENINELCGGFIAKGDSLCNIGKLDAGTSSYQRCFILVPAHIQATAGIEDALALKVTFAKADSIYQKAVLKENRKEYSLAKKLYKQSYELSGRKNAQNDMNRMENFIRAEKNPQDFALEIVRDFQNGIIPRNVNNKYHELENTYGDQVSTSEWKALFSFGEFKYEVRIDILSPGTSYYFAWRVHLIERSIEPLNKASEKMMGK